MGPKCPKCKKRNNIKSREIDSGASAYRIFVIYCADCGHIIGITSG